MFLNLNLVSFKAIRAQEQERGGHIPNLAMTAHAAGTDETWSLEAGMDAYLAKPVDISGPSARSSAKDGLSDVRS
jgi:CheY-like chemotaxis protein